jgi:hypothetical protein
MASREIAGHPGHIGHLDPGMGGDGTFHQNFPVVEQLGQEPHHFRLKDAVPIGRRTHDDPPELVKLDLVGQIPETGIGQNF